MCVLKSMDTLAGKVIHQRNGSIACDNKVDTSINKVEYAFFKKKSK